MTQTRLTPSSKLLSPPSLGIYTIRTWSWISVASLIFFIVLDTVLALSWAQWVDKDARAINLAGSLRMQSYRLATAIELQPQHQEKWIEDYQATLEQPELARLLADNADANLKQAFGQLKLLWISDIRPIFEAPSPPSGWLMQISQYVTQIDRFVHQLESHNQHKLIWFKSGALLNLLLFLCLSVLFLRHVYRSLLHPLAELEQATQDMSHGDFDVQISHKPDNELGQLGWAFEHMSHELAQQYRQLEEHLVQQEEALKLLYWAASSCSSSSLSASQTQELAQKLASFTQADALAVYLLPSQVHPIYLGNKTLCQTLLEQSTPSDPRTLFRPIAIDQEEYGYLLLHREQESWHTTEQAWLETLAALIASSYAHFDNLHKQQRLQLMQERATIARELHDSLAQALSYLKIQITRLGKNLNDPSKIESISQELKEGTDSAYQQLRSLITTFRLSMEGNDLETSLRLMQTQLQQRFHPVHVFLDNQLGNGPLNTNEQIHLLHIIREASLNALQHGRPNSLAITLQAAESGQIFVTIQDDGVGFDQQKRKEGHYGLQLLKERALALTGLLTIESAPAKGTLVSLEFTPLCYQSQTEE